MSIRPLAFLALLLAIAVAPVHAGDEPAVARLAAFLDAHGHQSGVPDATTSEAMRPLVTAGLDADIAVARMAQADFMRDHPDEKPPWIEGPLFNSSAYEPYTGYRFVAKGTDTDHAGRSDLTTVRVEFTDDSVTPTVVWHDEFLLRYEDGAWRVDDVAYGAGFGFGNHGTLRGNLRGENLAEPAEDAPAETLPAGD